MPVGCEQGDSNRHIIGTALFSELRRAQIQGNTARFQAETAIPERSANTICRLAHRSRQRADEGDGGKALLDIRFAADQNAFGADETGRINFL